MDLEALCFRAVCACICTMAHMLCILHLACRGLLVLFIVVFAAALEDSLEAEGDGVVVREKTAPSLDEKRRHELKCHEVFLSRQVETLPATHIRGKCSVTLLSEAESPLSYLEHDVSCVLS